MSAVATQATTEAVRGALRGRRFKGGEAAFQGFLLLTLLLSLAVLVTLLTRVLVDGLSVLTERGLGFVTASLSSLPDLAGPWQGIIGSLKLMLFVVVLAIPLGVGAAVYMEEYARDTRITRFLNANIRNLAGVPSIIYGILGLAVFVEALKSITGPGSVQGRSLISGGLTLSILVLPIVIITTAEAMRAVPVSIREAGYSVGATRWEVIRSHVLPYAAPGIFTGTILSVARAIGEAAPLIMVGAVTGFLGGNVEFFESFQRQFTALPIVIFQWARYPNAGFRAITAAAIIVLMVVLLLLNITAILLRNRYERKW
jgi:phosphate transport system permease protein